jgi:hypothetical protein
VLQAPVWPVHLCNLHKKQYLINHFRGQALIVPFAQMAYNCSMQSEPRDIRLPLMVSRIEAAAIDAWRYANRVPSRAEAVRRLIELGLKAAESGRE